MQYCTAELSRLPLGRAFEQPTSTNTPGCGIGRKLLSPPRMTCALDMGAGGSLDFPKESWMCAIAPPDALTLYRPVGGSSVCQLSTTCTGASLEDDSRGRRIRNRWPSAETAI